MEIISELPEYIDIKNVRDILKTSGPAGRYNYIKEYGCIYPNFSNAVVGVLF